MATKYLVIGPVRVHDLSATQPDIIAGYPMPTAVAGFGYKLRLDVEKILGEDLFEHGGTAVIVHSHTELQGHSKNPQEDKDKARAGAGAPIIDEFRAKAVLSFVVSLEERDADSDYKSELMEAAEALGRRVPEWIFAGGKVMPIVGGRHATKTSYASPETLARTLRRLPPGYLLIDRHDLMVERVEAGRDTLDALLDLLEATEVEIEGDGDERPKKVWRRRQRGWIVPLSVGFQAIERPRVRSKARVNDGRTPHVYAETIYSVGEYRSLATQIARQGHGALEGALWRHRTFKNSETFFVSAHNQPI
jgi:CRISPR-associated protein Csy2